MSINELVDKIYSENLLTEEDVRAKIVPTILYELGYPSANIVYETPVYWSEGSKVGSTKRADAIAYAIALSERDFKTKDNFCDSSLVVVEVKKPNTDLAEAHFQVQFYSSWVKPLFYIVTNGRETHFSVCHSGVADDDKSCKSRDDYHRYWPSIIGIFSYKNACSKKGKLIKARKEQQRELVKYCQRLSEEKDEHGIARRVLRISESQDELPSESLLDEQFTMLHGDAGVGKTFEMRKLVKLQAQRFLDDPEPERIPIVVEAKYWMGAFESLIEGIAACLDANCDGISTQYVEAIADKLLVVIDGLDEVLVKRSSFFQEINRFRQKYSSQILVTSRFEADEKHLGSPSCFSLRALNDIEIKAYLAATIENSLTVLYEMPQSLHDLIKNPLYLNMLVEYLTSTKSSMLPANIFELYDYYVDAALMKYEVKHSIAVPKIDHSVIKEKLGEFAYKSVSEFEKPISLKLLLEEGLSAESAQEVVDISLGSGLVCEKDGDIRFGSYSLQEYFAANWLSHEDNQLISTMIQLNNSEAYARIVVLLVGSLKNKSAQKVILDYLENNDLPLYIECLRKRYSLSNEHVRVSMADVEDMLIQMLDSFENLSKKYFAESKEFMPFWQVITEGGKGSLGVVADFNPQTTELSIEIVPATKNSDRVSVTGSDIEAMVTITSDHGVMPVFSMTSSAHPTRFFFNLKQVFGGVDCGRELAIKMLISNANDFFKSVMTLPTEPYAMQCCYIEEVVSKIDIDEGNGKLSRLSLKKYPVSVIQRILKDAENERVRIGDTIVSLGAFPYLLEIIKRDGFNPKDALSPEMDTPENANRTWQCYSDEVYCKWAGTFYDYYQESYRQYVETFFPNIACLLPFYSAGPVQFRVAIAQPSDTDRFSDRSFVLTWIPKKTLSECKTDVAVVPDGELMDFRDDEFQRHLVKLDTQMSFLGRESHYTRYSSHAGMTLLYHDRDIRKEVLKTVKKEITKLFEGKS